jgi:hypothetical protein
MTKSASRFRLVLPLLATAGVACQGNDGPPIDGKAATTQAALNAEAAIKQAGMALGFTLADDGTLSKTLSATGTSTTVVTTPMMSTVSAGMPPSMLRAVIGPSLTRKITGMDMPSMMTAEEKFDQAATEVRQLMEDRLFVDTNLEGMSGDTATYLLQPDPTCRPLPLDTDPPGTVPAIDSSCQDDLTKVAVRIAVKSDGDGVRLTILIGPAELELAAFVIHSDLLSVEVGLSSAKAANDYIQQQLGDGSPTGTYDRFTGRLGASLKEIADQKVTASLAILEAVDIAPTGGAEVASAATNPLFAVTGDGVSKTATLQMGLGATEIDTTWDPQGTGASNRDLHVSLGGLYGTEGLDENAQKVTLTNVGIGETKIIVRSSTIFDLNLNPNDMRRYSGSISVNPSDLVNANDTAHIELTPKLALSLAFDYAAVAADYATPPSAAVANDTYGITLANGGATVKLETVPSSATFTGGVRVLAGTLTLTAASAPSETKTVSAGQCLSSLSTAPAGTNALLGAVVISACP